ncbi:hypothetical protein M3Y97_00140200 [Aphelenchoides bicaudatus]|nr:hypothetical protein M3Y97_00140200 [Aphelenchoides bicaudatus]
MSRQGKSFVVKSFNFLFKNKPQHRTGLSATKFELPDAPVKPGTNIPYDQLSTTSKRKVNRGKSDQKRRKERSPDVYESPVFKSPIVSPAEATQVVTQYGKVSPTTTQYMTRPQERDRLEQQTKVDFDKLEEVGVRTPRKGDQQESDDQAKAMYQSDRSSKKKK